MDSLAQVNIGNIFHSRFGQMAGSGGAGAGGLGLADLFSLILSNAIALAGIILFFLLIVGGFMVISGAGSGNKENVARGKKAVTSALIGFLIIFVSYWIIVIVEKIFGFSILNPTP